MNTQLPLPVTAPFTRAERAALFNLVARAARTEIMPRFRKLDAGQIDMKTGPLDLVTEADTAVEAMIARGLQRAYPHALIIGEEMAQKTPDFREQLEQAELAFIIDPVDGTWNFAHGIPVFGTILAATRFGRPVFGLICDPVGQDLVWADLETPTHWHPRQANPRRTATSDNKELSSLRGYLEPNSLNREQKEHLALACLDLAQTTTLRCSAYEFRLLAQGAVDFVLSTSLTPWDHSAGVLLCQQAGGYAALLDASKFNAAKSDGILLSAASKPTWDILANHFAKLAG